MISPNYPVWSFDAERMRTANRLH